MTSLDAAVRAAQADGADILVSPFDDPIGKDALIQWPGGVNMQLCWHTTPPSYPALHTVPENRVYVSAERASTFVKAFSRSRTVRLSPTTAVRRASRLAARPTPIAGFVFLRPLARWQCSLPMAIFRIRVAVR